VCVCVYSVCVYSVCVYSVCVYRVCLHSVFTVCVFTVCVFTVCVYIVCLPCVCVYRVCVFTVCVCSHVSVSIHKGQRARAKGQAPLHKGKLSLPAMSLHDAGGTEMHAWVQCVQVPGGY
jgi:hypothetical protein